MNIISQQQTISIRQNYTQVISAYSNVTSPKTALQLPSSVISESINVYTDTSKLNFKFNSINSRNGLFGVSKDKVCYNGRIIKWTPDEIILNDDKAGNTIHINKPDTVITERKNNLLYIDNGNVKNFSVNYLLDNIYWKSQLRLNIENNGIAKLTQYAIIVNDTFEKISGKILLDDGARAYNTELNGIEPGETVIQLSAYENIPVNKVYFVSTDSFDAYRGYKFNSPATLPKSRLHISEISLGFVKSVDVSSKYTNEVYYIKLDETNDVSFRSQIARIDNIERIDYIAKNKTSNLVMLILSHDIGKNFVEISDKFNFDNNRIYYAFSIEFNKIKSGFLVLTYRPVFSKPPEEIKLPLISKEKEQNPKEPEFIKKLEELKSNS